MLGANRPILIPSVPVSEELKFGMVVSFLVAWYEPLPSCLVVLGRFLPLGLALICPGQGILDGTSVHMAWLLDHWNPVIITASRLYVRFLGYPKGSALELLDATLKLRHCTSLFTMHFPPWSLPRDGSGKRQFVAPGDLPDAGGNAG